MPDQRRFDGIERVVRDLRRDLQDLQSTIMSRLASHTHPGGGGGGGGAVESVNGQTGAVTLDAADVGAQPTDSDLTTIASLAPSNGSFLKRVAGAWAAATLAKGDVGLGNVDNTSDADKPVSTAQQTALDAKLAMTAAPELIRDTMGTALVAGSNVTVTPNDGGDTITIAASGGGGGVTDHGALTGLEDDDHPQYRRTDQDVDIAAGQQVNVGGSGSGAMVALQGAATSTDAITSRVSGDTSSRLLVDADGTFSWGPGSAAVDTVLKRGAADRLETPDTFRAAALEIGTTDVATALAGKADVGHTHSSGVGQLLVARCTANTSRATTTTFADVTGLGLTLEANAKYALDALILYTAPAAGDLRLQWTGPSGFSGQWSAFGPPTGSASNSDTSNFGAFAMSGGVIAVGGVSISQMVHIAGFVDTTTAGTLALQMAQLVASGTTTVSIGSWVRVHRIA